MRRHPFLQKLKRLCTVRQGTPQHDALATPVDDLPLTDLRAEALQSPTAEAQGPSEECVDISSSEELTMEDSESPVMMAPSSDESSESELMMAASSDGEAPPSPPSASAPPLPSALSRLAPAAPPPPELALAIVSQAPHVT